MVSHRFLEQFVGQTGQQQTLDLLNQVPQGLSLGIAYASLLCLILSVARCNDQHDLAQDPKRNINKNELRRNDTYVRTQECSL